MGPKTYEERREERRAYERDVEYEVWRNGGDMDRVNRDRVEDHHYNGDSVDSAARDELRHQRPPIPEPEPEQQFPPEE